MLKAAFDMAVVIRHSERSRLYGPDICKKSKFTVAQHFATLARAGPYLRRQEGYTALLPAPLFNDLPEMKQDGIRLKRRVDRDDDNGRK